jgi:hypothetical protein
MRTDILSEDDHKYQATHRQDDQEYEVGLALPAHPFRMGTPRISNSAKDLLIQVCLSRTQK